MRFKDIPVLKYFIKHEGPSRRPRRAEEAAARKGNGLKKAKPRNWNRDKHERRKEQKRRRKQSWK